MQVGGERNLLKYYAMIPMEFHVCHYFCCPNIDDTFVQVHFE